jgi:hypothetical protein
MKDPEYLAEMERTRRELEPVGGVEIQQMLANVAKAPKSTLEKLNSWIRRQ